MYFSQFRVDPNDNKFQYVLGISGTRSVDGGKAFTSSFTRGVHADQHSMWIDSNDGRHMILGCDGGLYVTYDRAKTWDPDLWGGGPLGAYNTERSLSRSRE